MNEVDLGARALWTLVPTGIFAGFLTLFIFRRYSDQHAIRVTMNRILAHMMEFRLFIDEPALVMQANRDLIRENWQLMRLLLRPSLIIALGFLIIYTQMDAFYGRAPLRIEDPTLVTVQLKHVSGAAMPRVALKAPGAIAIETPAVRVVSEHQISWRIRPLEPISGDLVVIGPDRTETKTITAGLGIHYLSEWRVSSPAVFLLRPVELPLFDSALDWIEIKYPSATILGWHWLVWFLAISSATAIVIHAAS